MAKYIGIGGNSPHERSEFLVATALKELSDDWVIFHHVSWQSKRNRREGDGEADFLMLHPKKGLLVVEVKGGGVQIANGQWISTNRHGETNDIKNPFEQALASKHALVKWLKGHGYVNRLRIGHAVAFPDMTVLPNMGPAATAQICWTKPNLEELEGSIERCISHWSLSAELSEVDLKNLIQLLAPTTSLSPSLSGASGDAEKELLILTAEQVEVFLGIRSQRGGVVVGGAGTGKTLLAVARAQQLAKDGFSTLLTCYNELLGAELERRVSGGSALSAKTFHSLCVSEALRAQISLPMQMTANWWERTAPEILIEACAKNGTSYDAIVVDEAQDFSPYWIDALRCILSSKADAPFFEFADSLQDFWKRDWTIHTHPFVYQLSKNMRNTRQIASRVAAVFSTGSSDRGVNGPSPSWRTTVGNPRESDVILATELLLNEGFGPGQIVVLCDDVKLVSQLRERSIGAFSYGKWGSKGVPVESVYRFKGLETSALILCVSDKSPDSKTVAYVGMSRARSILIVIGPERIKEMIGWIEENH